MHAVTPKAINGSGKRILIVHTRWNNNIVSALTNACIATLVSAGVERENIVVTDVPGAFELPFAIQRLLPISRCDAAIAIGCLIKGGWLSLPLHSRNPAFRVH